MNAAKSWDETHAEHAEYARDKHLAEADIARIKYRYYRRFEDYKTWKECIRIAWRMRAILRRSKA